MIPELSITNQNQMTKYYHFLIILCLSGLTLTCNHKSDYAKPVLSNDGVHEIIKLKDQRDTKALIPFFLSDDYQLREQSALAFGSIQDTAALTSLYTMIEEDEPIAQAAAFAIGQTGAQNSVKVLQKILERSMLPATRFEIFDALGKCGDIDLNYFLASNYHAGKDADGIAWALMALALRKKMNQAGVDLAYALLENEYDYPTRMAAATALTRAGIDLPWRRSYKLFRIENMQDVKTIMALMLKNMPNQEINQEFIDQISSSYYLTRINVLRTFKDRNNEYLVNFASEILKTNQKVNTQIAAAEYLASIAGEATHFLYSNPKLEINWRVKAILFDAAIREQNPRFIKEASKHYLKTTNLYEKGMYLKSLGQLPGKKEWLMHQIMDHDSIVSTYGMEAMILMLEKSDRKESFAPFLYETLNAEKDAIISLSAAGFRYEAFKGEINIELLVNKQAELQLPDQMEAFLELQKTINFLSESNEKLPDPHFNHPIDIDQLASLDSLLGFRVETSRGNLFIKVFPNEAPGTVLSLKDLVDQGYYNQKLFHRVVPNFVVQTGCPEGDGWGSLGFSIRSEFSKKRFTRGSVGMASAGKDTESCQWFITHSPTPHLNGKYTLFGEVSEGMEIVDEIEIGDRIQRMYAVYK